MTENKQNIDVVLLSDCLVGDTFSVDPYDQLLSADTLHLRLRANISEEQFRHAPAVFLNQPRVF